MIINKTLSFKLLDLEQFIKFSDQILTNLDYFHIPNNLQLTIKYIYMNLSIIKKITSKDVSSTVAVSHIQWMFYHKVIEECVIVPHGRWSQFWNVLLSITLADLSMSFFQLAAICSSYRCLLVWYIYCLHKLCIATSSKPDKCVLY